MRGHPWMTLALLLACTPPVEEGTTGDSEATESDSEASDSEPPTSGDGGLACIPGKVEVCPCAGGGQGVQTCDPDGQGYGPCDCPDPTGMTGEASSSGEPPDETTSGGETSSGETGAGETTGETTTTDETTGDPPLECRDPDDAPGGEDDALVVEDQSCFDRPKMLSGVLAGAADSDWYTYHGECFGQPEVLHNLDAADAVRLCVFVDCDMGTPDFQCANGSQMNVSPNGLVGCCGGASISFELNCMGGGENAQVLVRMDMGTPDACVDYTVEYSYNDGF